MYKYLNGILVEAESGSLIIEVNGIGFLVRCTKKMSDEVAKKIQEKILVWTYFKVREDAMELYGFADKQELFLFEKLIGVNGVGPKSGLSILDLASVDDLYGAIDKADAGFLSKASGVGKKTAQRIIVELKGKLAQEISEGEIDGELGQVMRSLGYTPREYQDIIRLVPKELDLDKKIAWMLKKMGANK